VDWSQLFPYEGHPELGRHWKIVMEQAGAAARDAAERAIKLDPKSAEAHLAMAHVCAG
jgi:Tfp pilus assembly protein PilF